LSRIDADITIVGPPGSVVRPAGVDLRVIVERAIGETPSGVQASVWVADGRAMSLRRNGKSAGPRSVGGRSGEVIQLDIGTRDRLAREVAGYGADALVLEPAALRDDVLARLRAQAGAEEGR
jgi:proteasome accessory factor B